MMLLLLNDIVNLVTKKFNRVKIFDYEVGTTLWKRNDLIVCGRLIHSENCLSVKPYSKGIPKILKFHEGLLNLNQKFLGDYHTHVDYTQSWASQFPSSCDLKAPSVLGDYWPIENNSAIDIDITPQFQIIHSMVDGDFFLLTPKENRSKYASINCQQRDIEAICNEYYYHYMLIDNEYGDIEGSSNKLTSVVRQEISKINNIIGKRAIMRFYSNSQDEWIT